MAKSQHPHVLRGDAPIQVAAEDVLDRSILAAHFADQLLAFDLRYGLVVGVLGPWGAGKTSFLNLLRKELADRSVPIVAFNPWVFSGADQLVDAFFVELSAQLRLKPGLREIGDRLGAYGEAVAGFGWVPLIGAWIERGRVISNLLASLMKRRREGTDAQRRALQSALTRLDRPIVIVLDDVDRLTTAEIRDVFKLVRLTASFTNIIYIVAFDRLRVEQALAETGVPGRSYLEKILEIALDLPVIPDTVLNRQVFMALDAALEGVEGLGELDSSWSDVYLEVIRPLVRNLRDTRRFASAVYGTATYLAGQVALVDLLGVEAIRVFLPDVFSAIPGAVAGLTTTSGLSYGNRESPELRAQVEALLNAAGDHAPVVRALIRRLFPAAERHLGGTHYGSNWQGRWLREHRVAHESILRLYLERTAGTTLSAFRAAERAWPLMSDEAALDGYLRSLQTAELEEVITSLEHYEDEFRREHVQPAVTVLLNLLPDLPEKQRGMFDLDSRLVVGRVVYRLLRVLDHAEAVPVVESILPRLSSLGSKFELITDVGYREGAGHKFVPADVASLLERQWREEVRSADPSSLATERDLLRILLFTKRGMTTDEGDFVLPDVPEVDLALLRSARTDVRSQSAESRGVRIEPRLAWDALVDLYGDEDTLVTRLERVRERADPELMALADRYASGWRPPEWGE